MKTIHFVDYGQDYLAFEIDDDGLITSVLPYQDPFWRGARVINHLGIESGAFVQYEKPEPGKGLVVKTIMYPVQSVVCTRPAEEASHER